MMGYFIITFSPIYDIECSRSSKPIIILILYRGTSINYTEKINAMHGSIAVLSSAKDKPEKYFSFGTNVYIKENLKIMQKYSNDNVQEI